MELICLDTTILIDIEDVLISGIAKRHQLQVATINSNHFSRITGLQLVDLTGI